MGAAVAGVVEHWQNVFRVTHLALGELPFSSTRTLNARKLTDAHSPPPTRQPRFAPFNLNCFSPSVSLEAKKVPPPADWEDQTPILPPGTMPDRIVRIPTEDPALADGAEVDSSVF